MIWYFIPGNVPSLKNSKKIIILRPKNKSPIYSLTSSDRHKVYAKTTGFIWKVEGKKFKLNAMGIAKPYNIGFYFVRDSKRKFDYSNAIDTVQDLMVTYGWIDDDNADEIVPVICGHHVSKNSSGVHMGIIDSMIAMPNPFDKF